MGVGLRLQPVPRYYGKRANAHAYAKKSVIVHTVQTKELSEARNWDSWRLSSYSNLGIR